MVQATKFSVRFFGQDGSFLPQCDRRIYYSVVDYSVTYAKFGSLCMSEDEIVIIYDSIKSRPWYRIVTPLICKMHGERRSVLNRVPASGASRTRRGWRAPPPRRPSRRAASPSSRAWGASADPANDHTDVFAYGDTPCLGIGQKCHFMHMARSLLWLRKSHRYTTDRL